MLLLCGSAKRMSLTALWHDSRVLLGVLVILLVVAPFPVRSGMYQYTDDSGVLHYVDSESKIPEKYRRAAIAHTPKGNAIRTETERPEPGRAGLNEISGTGISGEARVVASDSPESLPVANAARPNSPEFWKRRRHLLEEKIRNLKGDCEYWRTVPAPSGTLSAAASATRDRGLKQCDGLARAKQNLDSLASEIRKQGGNPAWISD